MEATAQLNYGWFRRQRRLRPRPPLVLSNSAPFRQRLPRRKLRFNPNPQPYDKRFPEHFTRPIVKGEEFLNNALDDNPEFVTRPINGQQENFKVPEIPPFRQNYPRLSPPSELPENDLGPLRQPLRPIRNEIRNRLPEVPFKNSAEFNIQGKPEYNLRGGSKYSQILDETFGKTKKFNNYLIHHKRNILPDEGKDNIQIFPKEDKKSSIDFPEFPKLKGFGETEGGFGGFKHISNIANNFKFDLPSKTSFGSHHQSHFHGDNKYIEPEKYQKPPLFQGPEVYHDPEDTYQDSGFGRPKPPRNFNQHDPYEENYRPIPEYLQPKPPKIYHEKDDHVFNRPPRNINKGFRQGFGQSSGLEPPRNLHQNDPYEDNTRHQHLQSLPPKLFQNEYGNNFGHFPQPPKNIHSVDTFEKGYRPPIQYKDPVPPTNFHHNDHFEQGFTPSKFPDNSYKQPPLHPLNNPDFFEVNHKPQPQPYHEESYHESPYNEEPYHEENYHESPYNEEPYHEEHFEQEYVPEKPPKPYVPPPPPHENGHPDLLEDKNGCTRPDGSFVAGGATWNLSDCRMGICAKSLKGGWEIATER